jgi:hypothetical protein
LVCLLEFSCDQSDVTKLVSFDLAFALNTVDYQDAKQGKQLHVNRHQQSFAKYLTLIEDVRFNYVGQTGAERLEADEHGHGH